MREERMSVERVFTLSTSTIISPQQEEQGDGSWWETDEDGETWVYVELAKDSCVLRAHHARLRRPMSPQPERTIKVHISHQQQGPGLGQYRIQGSVNSPAGFGLAKHVQQSGFRKGRLKLSEAHRFPSILWGIVYWGWDRSRHLRSLKPSQWQSMAVQQLLAGRIRANKEASRCSDVALPEGGYPPPPCTLCSFARVLLADPVPLPYSTHNPYPDANAAPPAGRACSGMTLLCVGDRVFRKAHPLPPDSDRFIERVREAYSPLCGEEHHAWEWSASDEGFPPAAGRTVGAWLAYTPLCGEEYHAWEWAAGDDTTASPLPPQEQWPPRRLESRDGLWAVCGVGALWNRQDCGQVQFLVHLSVGMCCRPWRVARHGVLSIPCRRAGSDTLPWSVPTGCHFVPLTRLRVAVELSGTVLSNFSSKRISPAQQPEKSKLARSIAARRGAGCPPAEEASRRRETTAFIEGSEPSSQPRCRLPGNTNVLIHSLWEHNPITVMSPQQRQSAAVSGRHNLVVSFQLKNTQAIECGGGYIKVLRGDFEPTQFHSELDYLLMFGPDVCGSMRKVQLILNYNRQHSLTWRKEHPPVDDRLTHVYSLGYWLYTVIINYNGTYEYQLDGEMQEKGLLATDFAWGDGKCPAPCSKDCESCVYTPVSLANCPVPFCSSPVPSHDTISGVGIELWQVQSGTIFDNIIIGNDIEEVDEFIEQTWRRFKDSERRQWQRRPATFEDVADATKDDIEKHVFIIDEWAIWLSNSSFGPIDMIDGVSPRRTIALKERVRQAEEERLERIPFDSPASFFGRCFHSALDKIDAIYQSMKKSQEGCSQDATEQMLDRLDKLQKQVNDLARAVENLKGQQRALVQHEGLHPIADPPSPQG
eukprot:gene41385-biopygen85997